MSILSFTPNHTPLKYRGPIKVYIGSLSVKLILASQEGLEWAWPSMIRNRLLIFQIQHYLWNIHHKGKNINLLYAKQPTENHREPTSDEKSHWN